MRQTNDPLGKALRELREHAGLQQGQLGRKSGVTQSNISAYELGKRAPQWPTLVRLLDAMGADLLDLSVKMEEPGRLEETREALWQLLKPAEPEEAEPSPPATDSPSDDASDQKDQEHPLDYLVDAVIDRIAERTVMRQADRATAQRSALATRNALEKALP
ncbi:MAG: helix-turn-helix transcriptional regulator [Acidobacteriota bacterium]